MPQGVFYKNLAALADILLASALHASARIDETMRLVAESEARIEDMEAAAPEPEEGRHV